MNFVANVVAPLATTAEVGGRDSDQGVVVQGEVVR